jgi:hypothetical protein
MVTVGRDLCGQYRGEGGCHIGHSSAVGDGSSASLGWYRDTCSEDIRSNEISGEMEEVICDLKFVRMMNECFDD